MDYSETDLTVVNAKLNEAERRQIWMSEIVIALKARNYAANIAERQQATFAQMVETLGDLRSRMEEAIIAKRKRDTGE